MRFNAPVRRGRAVEIVEAALVTFAEVGVVRSAVLSAIRPHDLGLNTPA